MAKKEQIAFLLQKDQKEIVDELTNEEAGIIFKAIYEYEVTKTIPKLERTLRIVFKQFKAKLDIYDEAYELKCLKNKENIEKRWSKKEDTNEYDRIRMNTNYTNKRKIKKNKIKENKINKNNNTPKGVYSRVKLDDTPLFSEIISCFNKIGIKEESFVKNKMEFHFRNSENNKKKIQKILDMGYSKEDIMDVIYLKYDQWIENNDKNKRDMSTYYRPSTILGEKFEEYYEEAKMKEIS